MKAFPLFKLEVALGPVLRKGFFSEVAVVYLGTECGRRQSEKSQVISLPWDASESRICSCLPEVGCIAMPLGRALVGSYEYGVTMKEARAGSCHFPCLLSSVEEVIIRIY